MRADRGVCREVQVQNAPTPDSLGQPDGLGLSNEPCPLVLPRDLLGKKKLPTWCQISNHLQS